MTAAPRLIYHHHITDVLRPEPHPSLSTKAYDEIRRMIVRLDLAPGAVIREDELRTSLGLGRTPIREAIQRLVRDQFVTVMPRRGMFVSGIDVAELATLYETRAIIEPYAARLACRRADPSRWDGVRAALQHAPDTPTAELLELDRQCHEAVWAAASNRFLTDTLDMLYAHSDRLWHLYLADVDDMADAVDEHVAILDALRDGDADLAASLTEQHIRSFDAQIRTAVRRHLDP